MSSELEAVAVSDYLRAIDAKDLDTSRCQVTDSIVQTDIQKLSTLANTSGRGWPDDPNAGPCSFVRNVTLAADLPDPDQADE